MNRDDLLYKWLNHDLNAEEFEAFKLLEDYPVLIRLNHGLQRFEAPAFESSEALNAVLKQIENKKSKTSWLPIAASIAAIFVVCFGFYFYTTSLDSTFKTLASEKQDIELPDGSFVELNAMSELAFNDHNWNSDRLVKLDGEAFFKVIKGSKFEVKTSVGTITVIGTQFNIKQRHNYFEVICYEGLVHVNFDSYNLNLPKGHRFLIRDGKRIETEDETTKAPSWIANYSQFQSVPYHEVLEEFERQYDVKINQNTLDDTQLFTGSFAHDDMETALKSITLPLQLTYNKTNRTITLKRE